VTGIAIYMEGGGSTAQGKATLRQGMSEFLGSLREAARQKRLTWKVVPCGSRSETRDAFLNANTPAFKVLLVDSEVAVADPSRPRAHLANPPDGWVFDKNFDEDSLHLMIQTMETWIVSDVKALEEFYEQGFVTSALPHAQNLELVTKADLTAALERATNGTRTKGKYHKIRHAGALLGKINPGIVRKRCPSCDRLFTTLLDRIG
jgi:uncharacterized protein DUF4276